MGKRSRRNGVSYCGRAFVNSREDIHCLARHNEDGVQTID